MNILVVIVLSVISATAIADSLLGLPPMPIPVGNVQNPKKAFTDGLEKAIGVNEAIGARNTPTLLNVGFFEQLFLDGRESSLEEQALKPILNRIEHGFSDQQSIIKIITTGADYLTQFKKVFGVDKSTMSTVHMKKAITSYERTLISGNSSFDQYYFGRDKS